MFVWLLEFHLQYHICAIYNKVYCVAVTVLLSSGFVVVGSVCSFLFDQIYEDAANYIYID